MNNLIIILVVEFFVFSFLGWIIDTGFRSYKQKKFTVGSYFPVPLCPIYGFGALVLIISFQFLYFLPIYLLLIIGALGIIAVEYFGALFSQKVLRINLWDYSKNKFNIQGRIDLEHSLFWALLAVVFYFLIFPWLP